MTRLQLAARIVPQFGAGARMHMTDCISNSYSYGRFACSNKLTSSYWIECSRSLPLDKVIPIQVSLEMNPISVLARHSNAFLFTRLSCVMCRKVGGKKLELVLLYVSGIMVSGTYVINASNHFVSLKTCRFLANERRHQAPKCRHELVHSLVCFHVTLTTQEVRHHCPYMPRN